MATIKHLGQRQVGTLAGQIKLEEGNGRLIIRDPTTLVPRQIQDIDGSHYYDADGNEMTLVDTRGVNTIDPTTGVYRGRFGIATTDNRPFSGFSKDDIDIRRALGEQ
jgi:hypothetical protein